MTMTEDDPHGEGVQIPLIAMMNKATQKPSQRI